MIENTIDVTPLSEVSDQLAYDGKTPMYIAIDHQLAGIIAVADTVKESSKQALEKLHEMGIKWR